MGLAGNHLVNVPDQLPDILPYAAQRLLGNAKVRGDLRKGNALGKVGELIDEADVTVSTNDHLKQNSVI